MNVKKNVEKAQSEDIDLFEDGGCLKVVTTLDKIGEMVKNSEFTYEQIAYFMFKLTADTDFKVEEAYVKFFADYYASLAQDDPSYKGLADNYKALYEEYKK